MQSYSHMMSTTTNNNGGTVPCMNNISYVHIKQQPTSIEEQNRVLINENTSLKDKLVNKTYEVNKLKVRVKELSTEVEQYRQLLGQVNHSLINGSAESINLAIENASQALSQMNKRKPLPKSLKKPPKSHINCSSCCATDKPYVCDWVNCGKRFRQKPHLEAHKSIHTGRRFLCEYNGCGKSFVRKYNLVEHQKLHSPNSVNTCTVIDCGKVFSSKYSLMRHQNAQHNMNVKFTSM